MSGSVAVVQRHAHERTHQAGLELAAREFPDATIAAVAAGDFPTTLRRCFETAVELDREWTVTLDGDVLLLPGSGDAVLHLARRLPRRAGHAWFLVHDLVTSEARAAGVRLYRTATMASALERGDWSGRVRPETELLQSLHGIEHRAPSVLVGLHDHEQYYRDLFRTAFVMARKKPAQREWLLRTWRARAAEPDFRALLAGAEASAASDGPLSFDAADYRELADAFLVGAGLTEKPPLTATPDPHDLERRVPAHALMLRRPGLAARRMPRVWRKAGNGVRGLTLARYALGRTVATALRR
jgi:hypothetical protein